MLKRSFLLLVVLGLVIQAVVSYLAWRAILAQLPCHWAVLGLRPTSPAACVHAIPIIGRKGWLSAIIVAVVDLTSLGLLVFELARQLARAHRFRRTLDLMPRQPLPSALASHHRLQVVTSNERLCFCIGFRAPTVIVSSRLVEELQADQLEAAIAHESSHQRRFDPVRLLLAAVIVRALFLLPALSDLGRASRVANELAADEFATRRFGRRALVGALRTIQDGPRLSASVSAMVGLDLLGERVAALSGEQVRVRLRRSLVVLSLVALIVLIGLSISIPSGTAPPRPLPVHRVTVVVPSNSH